MSGEYNLEVELRELANWLNVAIEETNMSLKWLWINGIYNWGRASFTS